DKVQDRDQEQGNRLAEVEQQLRLGRGEDLVRLAQVGLDDGGVGVVAQDELAVGDGDLIVVDVDDPGPGGDALGGLVAVVLGGDAGAYVEKLPDPGLACQEPDRSAQERPVGLNGGAEIGVQGDDRARGVAVSLKIVVAAQPVVVDAGDVRLGGVDPVR